MTDLIRRNMMMLQGDVAVWDGSFYFITDIIIPKDAVIKFRISLYPEQHNWLRDNIVTFFASNGTYSTGFMTGGASGVGLLDFQPIPYYQSKTYCSWGALAANKSRSHDIILRRNNWSIDNNDISYANGIPTDNYPQSYLHVGGREGGNINIYNIEYLQIYEGETMIHNLYLKGSSPLLYDSISGKTYKPIYI